MMRGVTTHQSINGSSQRVDSAIIYFCRMIENNDIAIGRDAKPLRLYLICP
jgi:hypothetical protein